MPIRAGIQLLRDGEKGMDRDMARDNRMREGE